MGPMYYSNDSQSTLSIIYVDFLSMAEKNGSFRWVTGFPFLSETLNFNSRFL